MVRPGLAPTLKAIGKDWQKVPSTAHLIVPVDAASEEHLHGFQEYLAWFPEDFETVVLYALVRPSLDDRGSILERQAFGRTATEEVMDKAAGRFRRTWRVLRRWARRPVPQIPAIATALVFLLGLNAFLLYGLTVHLDGDLGQSASWFHRTVGDEPDKEPSVTRPSSTAEGVVQVVRAVQAKSWEIRSFAELYQKHFAQAAGQDLAAGLKSAEKEAWEKLCYSGTVKLEALRLDPGRNDLSFLGGREWDNYTDTKAIFIAMKPALEGNQQSRDLLAALTCLIWSNPGIPATGTPAVTFAPPEKTFADVPLVISLPGLETLATFVTGYHLLTQVAGQTH